MTALQLSRMTGSGYFDYCYLCCLKNEKPIILAGRRFIETMAGITTFELIERFYPDYGKIGILVFNEKGVLEGEFFKSW